VFIRSGGLHTSSDLDFHLVSSHVQPATMSAYMASTPHQAPWVQADH
jgi:hypothetical protein